MKSVATGLLVLFSCALLCPSHAWAEPDSPDYLPESEILLKGSGGQPIRLLLAVGEERAYDLDFSANAGANGIAIGNPVILATTLVRPAGHPEQLVLKPLRVGHTSISVRLSDGELGLRIEAEVVAANVYRLATELREALRPLAGLNVRRIGPLLQVNGMLASPEEAGQYYQIISQKRYEPYVVNLALLSPQFFAGLAGRVQEEIIKFAPRIRVRAMGEQLWLEGEADSLEQTARAERVASMLLPEVLPMQGLAADPKARHLSPRSQVQNFVVISKPH